ncbi:hypothetical protein CDAR_238031 [Caerostris darwini]|uniref:Uncharacterized protein n=1 Tax=Caerostris darwini TaxID=1538125 RepID=A0AAV4S341_9ARAC|nr:hypothetical protein CDAR_238031 [Caerostris darwini]
MISAKSEKGNNSALRAFLERRVVLCGGSECLRDNSKKKIIYKMNFTISFHQILPGVPGAVSVTEKIIPGFSLGDMNLCIQKGHGRKAFKREKLLPV